MSLKKKFLFIFFLVCNFIFYGQNTFSITEAVNYSLNNNRSFSNSKIDIQKAKSIIWETTTAGLPQITSNINYSNFIELPVSLIPAEIFGGAKGTFAEVQFGTEQNASASFRVDQLIIDGSYIVALQTSKTYLDFEKNKTEKNRLELVKNIINAYTNVLIARESINILRQNTENLNTNYIETQKLYENGFVEEESVEQLNLNLSLLKSRLAYAEKMEPVTLDLLKLVMGYPIEDEITLSDNIEEIVMKSLIENDEGENSFIFDLDNNIDIRLAKNNVQLQKLSYKLEISRFFPRISGFLTGAYNGNSNTFTFLDREQLWFRSSSWGLKLDIPIFSSGKKITNTKRAKLTYLQAQNTLKDTEEKINLDAKQAYNNYNLAVENYYTQKKNLALAERIEKKNEKKYFEGVISSFEFRQVQDQLYASQNNYLQALSNIITQKINLETIINKNNL